MKIMIVCHSLSMGGIQRVAADLSRYWTGTGHEVTVVTMLSDWSDFYLLPKEAHRVILGDDSSNYGLRRMVRRAIAIRSVVYKHKPDVVVALGWRCGYFVGLAGPLLPCRTVVCEFGVPAQKTLGRYREWLRCITYRFADAVTSESQAVDDWMRSNYRVRRSVVIPKSSRWPLMAVAPELMPGDVVEPERKIILAAARLVPVKNFESLVRAFSIVAQGRSDWELVILGDGQCRSDLELLVKKLGLEGRVTLPGRAGNLGDWYQRASIFAVTSLHEGGPNTLIEALAHGLPAISYDCDEGPRTIIRDRVDGLLVPLGDEKLFAENMGRLMDDAGLLAQMAERAVEARQCFSEENAMRHWDKLFHDIGLRA